MSQGGTWRIQELTNVGPGLRGRVILEQQDGILGCGRKQGTRMDMDRGPVVVLQSPPCSGVPGNWGLTCWGLENLPVPTSPNPHPFSLLLALTVPSRHHSMLLPLCPCQYDTNPSGVLAQTVLVIVSPTTWPGKRGGGL